MGLLQIGAARRVVTADIRTPQGDQKEWSECGRIVDGGALPNIGFYLKRMMQEKLNLLFGLTNDAFGYMMLKEDFNSYPLYDYITLTCIHELAGDVLVDRTSALIGAPPLPQPEGTY